MEKVDLSNELNGFDSWGDYYRAKDELRAENLKQVKRNGLYWLEKDKSGKGFICPVCGSGKGNGAHKSGTGLAQIKGANYPAFTCFAGHCFKDGGDIVDIIASKKGITSNSGAEFAQLIDEMAKEIGLETEPQPKQAGKVLSASSQKDIIQSEEAETNRSYDFTDYINTCSDRLKAEPKALEYLHSRGLSDETISNFRLGYDENYSYSQYWDSMNAPAIVAPYNGACTYYIKRSIITDDAGGKYRKPKTDIAGKEPLYNAGVYKSDEVIFIVEGAFDAMAICQAGGRALAIVTTGTPHNLKAFIEKHLIDFKGCYVLALDNDQEKNGQRRGEEAQEKLVNLLNELGVKRFIEYHISGEYKDASEMLQKNEQGLVENVSLAIQAGRAKIAELDQVELEESDDIRPVGDYELLFRKHREDIAQSIRTGFKSLDIQLKGGFNNELYVIGAETGTGKSAIASVLAQNVAIQGVDVLYYALEMSRDEFIARGASMISFERHDFDGVMFGDILGDKYDEQLGTFTRLSYESYAPYVDEYFRRYGEHLYFIEGKLKRRSALEITETVRKFKSDHNIKQLVVIVDYLQLLKADEGDNSQRDNMHIMSVACTTLKALASQIGCTVFLISSMANDRKGHKVNDASFKYSGDIGYTGGVLLGWNWAGVTDTDDEATRLATIAKSKSEHSRAMYIDVLKNRNGERDNTVKLRYFPAYNYIVAENEIPSKLTEIVRGQGTNWESVEKGRHTKRNKEKNKLREAFEYLSQKGDVTVEDLADYLDIQTSTVKRKIKEFGGYSINGQIIEPSGKQIVENADVNFMQPEERPSFDNPVELTKQNLIDIIEELNQDNEAVTAEAVADRALQNVGDTDEALKNYGLL